MIKKKKAKRTAAKKAEKKADQKVTRKKPGAGKHADPARVLEDISGMVKSGARLITKAVMGHAMHGELAPAKYLLEMAGVYPKATDGSQTTSEEDSLAKTLMDRLNASPKGAAEGAAAPKVEDCGDHHGGVESSGISESSPAGTGENVTG
jgi:hypothetical protein